MSTTTIELQPRHSTQVRLDEDDSGLMQDPPRDGAQPAMRPVSRARQISILICAFMDVFITIGVNQSYGVYLTYYLDNSTSSDTPFLPPSETTSKAMLAFVGTLGSGLTWGGSILVNPWMARTKNPKIIPMIGAVLIGVGYILASFCNRVCVYLLIDSSRLRFLGMAITTDPRTYLWCWIITSLLSSLGCGTRIL